MAGSGGQVFKVIPHQEDFRTLKQKRGKQGRAESARSWLETAVTSPSTHSCWSRACQSCGHLGREPKKPPGQGRDSRLQVQRAGPLPAGKTVSSWSCVPCPHPTPRNIPMLGKPHPVTPLALCHSGAISGPHLPPTPSGSNLFTCPPKCFWVPPPW